MTPKSHHEKMNRPSLSRKRTIAITVGDVAGIGPEVSLRACEHYATNPDVELVLYGPKNAIQLVGDRLGLKHLGVTRDVGVVSCDRLIAGQPNAETGLASFEAVKTAIKETLSGKVDALVTGPIQKEAWHAAGIRYPGHTELLAAETDTSNYCMMLTSKDISCCLATIHIPLADVAKVLTRESIERAIGLAHQTLTQKLGRAARITVCALNPHAGENRQFSYGEEETIIQPAIENSRELGIEVSDPVPPDTAFTPAMRCKTDAYVCMYHDQGLIPLKALSFDDAVNVTLGLPIIRTSVDHGTALDLAWQGKANHQSMISAIEFALQSLQ